MTTKALCSALLCCVILTAASGPAQAVSIDLVPATQAVLAGDAVAVAVTISGLGVGAAPSLGTFDLDLSFDPALLGLVSVVFGDPVLGDQLDLLGLGSIASATAGTGVVNLFELSLDPAADLDSLQADNFTLATMSFDALAAGTSALGLAVNALGDADGNPLAASVGTGSVTVTAAAVPAPASLWLIGAGLLVVAGVAWRRGW